MERGLGYAALPTVDQGYSESEVFRSYFYRCADLLAGHLGRIFFHLRGIALAQSTLISRPPVEWAAIQAKVLVADESYGISLWLKFACDKESGAVDDIEWKSWRAPRWLFMQPFANHLYDRAKAWERMSEAETQHVLEVVEDRFNERLVTELEKAVDGAHIHQAMKPPAKVTASPQVPETERKTDREPTKSGSPGVTRKAFIKPILEKKGFSVNDWASKADVDFHTADNYLKGKTNPYPATLKKLADALGVEITQLPE
jgi:lambda repressor-like predicted transcriptional regulator